MRQGRQLALRWTMSHTPAYHGHRTIPLQSRRGAIVHSPFAITEQTRRQGQERGVHNRKLLHHVQQDTHSNVKTESSCCLPIHEMSTCQPNAAMCMLRERKSRARKLCLKDHSAAEVAEHELTLLPLRSWCMHCTQGLARDEAHRRQDDQVETAVPTISLDFSFTRPANDDTTEANLDQPQKNPTKLPPKPHSQIQFQISMKIPDSGSASNPSVEMEQSGAMKRPSEQEQSSLANEANQI